MQTGYNMPDGCTQSDIDKHFGEYIGLGYKICSRCEDRIDTHCENYNEEEEDGEEVIYCDCCYKEKENEV